MKELTQVIRRAVVTERSTDMKAFNKYVFEVHPESNKTEIRQAVETMFRVQVLTVRTMAVRGKWTRRMGKTSGYTSHWKKAIVRLRPGQEIKAAQEQLDAVENPGLPLDSAAQPEHAGGKTKKAGSKPAPKAKLSAEEALSGIATAIQEEERATTASPEAQQVEQPEPVTKTPAITAKFRGPNGETWSGRGLRPKWVSVYLDNGGVLENLLVQPEQSPADPLYAQALALIVREQKASKRLFKEELRIGQTKALQLLDELEQAGKVSPCDERGARKVLVAA